MKKMKFEKKEILPQKETRLEKGDFLALMIAISLEMLPVIALFMGGIFLFIVIWTKIFA